MKRAFRFKRIYRKKFRDFQNQIKSSIILMNLIFEKKNSQVKSFIFSMKKYVYSTNEFNVDFMSWIIVKNAHKYENESKIKWKKNLMRCDKMINISNNYFRFIKNFWIASILTSSSLTTARSVWKRKMTKIKRNG